MTRAHCRVPWRFYVCAIYSLLFGLITVINLDKLRRHAAHDRLAPTNSSADPPPAATVWLWGGGGGDRIVPQVLSSRQRANGRIDVAVLGAGALGDQPAGEALFAGANCQAANCRLVRHVRTAHLVVTDGVEVDWPLYANVRPANQLLVYYQLEPPTYTQGLSGADAVAFNYTATYRSDSDLVTPYAKYVHVDKVPEGLVPKRGWPAVEEVDLHGKQFAAAWLVSHCITRSRREAYARQLARHLRVDTFGRCGDKSCHRHSPECRKTLDQYMFYLSFENSRCDDYITEKYFHHGLGSNVVPIVLGASRQHYERVSPPHSFIHVDDFASAQQLADYLAYLNKNRTAYSEYFAWKGSYVAMDTQFWCRLCGLANERPYNVYDSIERWWNDPAKCTDDLK